MTMLPPLVGAACRLLRR